VFFSGAIVVFLRVAAELYFHFFIICDLGAIDNEGHVESCVRHLEHDLGDLLQGLIELKKVTACTPDVVLLPWVQLLTITLAAKTTGTLEPQHHGVLDERLGTIGTGRPIT
jgi:hypothetical protein